MAAVFQDLYSNMGLSQGELRLLSAARRSAGGADGAAVARALASLLGAAPFAAGNASSPADAFPSNLASAPTAAAPEDDPSAPVDIGAGGLLLAAAPLLLVCLISLRLRLDLHRKLVVGVARCVVQLSALGYILVPIFVANRWWLSACYASVMCLVAAAEAVSRPAHAYPGLLPQVLLAIGGACFATIAFGLAAAVRVRPWYDAQYLIPMLGMLLGNACSSVAVGLSSVLDELAGGGRDGVEALLALGASRVEASRGAVRRAARLALTPLLNSLNVVGIVSIPGMMTGQILGGSDPAVASRYQIVIFFLVTTSTALSAFATIYAAVLSVCDAHHRLRPDRLRPRQAAGAGAMGWLAAQAQEAAAAARGGAARATARVRRAFRGEAPSRSRHHYFSFRSPQVGAAAGPRSPGAAAPPPPPRSVVVQLEGGGAGQGVRRPLLQQQGEDGADPQTP